MSTQPALPTTGTITDKVNDFYQDGILKLVKAQTSSESNTLISLFFVMHLVSHIPLLELNQKI